MNPGINPVTCHGPGTGPKNPRWPPHLTSFELFLVQKVPLVTTLTILESLEWVESRFWVHLEVPPTSELSPGQRNILAPPPSLQVTSAWYPKTL